MIKPQYVYHECNFFKKEQIENYRRLTIKFIIPDNYKSYYYIEWYIKCEGVNPLLKDIIDIDYSNIEYDDEVRSLSFRINKYFCKRNNLHIKFINNYMVIPIMTTYSYNKYIMIDIYIKNNFNRYSEEIVEDDGYYGIKFNALISSYSSTSFFEKSFIKIPCVESQKLIDYQYQGGGGYATFTRFCKYIVIEVNNINNLYRLLEKYVKINIKVKPKLLHTLVIFKPTTNTDSSIAEKYMHNLLCDIRCFQEISEPYIYPYCLYQRET